jgi:hypothetical protein
MRPTIIRAVVVTASALALSACSHTTHAISKPEKNLSLSLNLRSLAVPAGTPIQGTVSITNNTKRTYFSGSNCYLGQWLQVGLTNSKYKFSTAIADNLCGPGTKIRPGRNEFPITVQSAYTVCDRSSVALDRDIPRCVGSGAAPPPLPAGQYETTISANISTSSVRIARPLEVTLY